MHIWEIVIVEFESKPCKLDKALLSSYQPLIVEKISIRKRADLPPYP